MVEITTGEWISILISATVAIILIISLKIQHHDIGLRQRPWLAGYGTSEKDSVELKNGLIILHMINRGPVPAFNIIPKAYTSTEEPKGSTNEFTTKEGFNQIDLGPLEDYHIAVKIPMGVNPQNVKIFYGFQIKYEDLDKNKKTLYN